MDEVRDDIKQVWQRLPPPRVAVELRDRLLRPTSE